MTNFQLLLAAPFLRVEAAPQRVDGTPGNILPGGALTYVSSDPTIATAARQPGAPSGVDWIDVVPVKGGEVTVTASGADENGQSVSAQFTVTVVADANPTSTYVFRKIA